MTIKDTNNTTSDNNNTNNYNKNNNNNEEKEAEIYVNAAEILLEPPVAASTSTSAYGSSVSSVPVVQATYVGTADAYADDSKPYGTTTTSATTATDTVNAGYSTSTNTTTTTTTTNANANNNTTNTTTTTTNTNVPPGAAPGGQWVMARYRGKKTWAIAGATSCLLCIFCVSVPWALACGTVAAGIADCCGCCCANQIGSLCDSVWQCDKTRAYMAPNGDLINPTGKVIGHRDKNKWM